MNNSTFNKEPVTQVDIRFQDCDPFGHLNNARYIDYFLNVREDHLADEYDLDIYKRQREQNKNWVVAKTKIAYIAPVYFREKVCILTRLINYNDTSLFMEGVMTDKNQRYLKSVVWIEFRHFDLSGKKLVPHSKRLMVLFDQIFINDINPASFDARVKEIIRGVADD